MPSHPVAPPRGGGLSAGLAAATLIGLVISGPPAGWVSSAERTATRAASATSGPVSPDHPLHLLRMAAAEDRTSQTARATNPTPAHAMPLAAHQPDTGSDPSAPLALQWWPGTSLNSQSLAFGSADQSATPPDPDIAIGPNWVVETTNDSLFVDTRDGSSYPDPPGESCPAPGPTELGYTAYSLSGCDRIDLNNFVDSNGWRLSDVRVVYDGGAGEFYLSFQLFTTPAAGQSCAPGYPNGDTCSLVFLMHTSDGDPTGEWDGDFFTTYNENVVADQPMVGFSATTIGISWDEENLTGGWYGDESLVLSKSLFLAGASQPVLLPAGGILTAPDTSHFSLDPVPELSPGPTLYFVANDAAGDLIPGGGSNLFVMAITGDTAGSIRENDYFITMPDGSSTSPPDAPQPGTSTLIATDDDRINDGFWSGGVLWTGFNESCTPPGDAAARACIRYVEVSTAPMQILKEITFGLNGEYVYYPSFGIDPQGDLFTTFSASSPSVYPSIVAMGIGAGQGSFAAPETVVSGTGPYWYYGSQSPPTLCDPSFGGCRFGDFAGGAIDPAHPQDFWFADEVQLDSTDPGDWGTALGRLTYATPSIANLTPAVGPAAGGTRVTVNGADFGPTTSFTFAGTPTSISNLTPDSFTFSTPPGSPGNVNAVATDPLGSTSPATYLYVAASRYQPVAPYRILDTRSASCVQCGSGALRAGETRTIAVGGYTPPGYGGAIVPTSATAVVLNVTATDGTANTYLTVLPTGGGVPTASNLNPAPGQIVPNLVTVALGSSAEVSIYNHGGSVDVVADIDGYYTSAPGGSGEYHPLFPPSRVCDTRAGQGTPCAGSTAKPLGARESRLVAVTGSAVGIADGGDAAAAVLNLTAVQPTASTYLTVYPPTPNSGSGPSCGAAPLASNLNVNPGAVQPNRVITPVLQYQGSGYVCVYNHGGTVDVILDVNGWFGDGADTGGTLFYALGPSRICDTRYTQGTECAGSTLQTGATLTVPVSGVGPLPSSGIAALVGNVTAVEGSQSPFLTVYPDAASRPATSDLNPAAGQIIANLTIVGVAGDGKIDVYNSLGSTDVVIDAVGWFQ